MYWSALMLGGFLGAAWREVGHIVWEKLGNLRRSLLARRPSVQGRKMAPLPQKAASGRARSLPVAGNVNPRTVLPRSPRRRVDREVRPDNALTTIVLTWYGKDASFSTGMKFRPPLPLGGGVLLKNALYSRQGRWVLNQGTREVPVLSS